MTTNKVCSKCNHELVACYIRNSLELYIKKLPKKLMSKKESVVDPYVCTNCGLTEWYVREPDKFK
ncbi:MAG: hypothetical protein IMW92_13460 [Bacillales bacterium]|nr:hypothetical protein [Bacillales bacterium]